MGTGSNRFNNNNNNNFGNNNNGGWGMNPMMMGMMGQGGGAGGQGGFDQNAMAQMYQSMGWGNQNWNPQMAAWQQMMASMTGQQGGAAGAGGMDMGAMMNSMGMGGMGGMGMMGGMGSMSPPTATSMSPTLGAGTVNNAQRGSSNGPSGGNDREPPSGPRGGNGPSNSRFQRGGSHNAGGSRPPPTGPSGYNGGSRDDRERSPNHRRERSPIAKAVEIDDMTTTTTTETDIDRYVGNTQPCNQTQCNHSFEVRLASIDQIQVFVWIQSCAEGFYDVTHLTCSSPAWQPRRASSRYQDRSTHRAYERTTTFRTRLPHHHPSFHLQAGNRHAQRPFRPAFA